MREQSSNSNMNPSGAITAAVFLGIVALVHVLYQGVVRPLADAAIAAQGSGATSNLWVIFKDFEQQASVSIGLFCAFLIIYKYQRIVLREEPLFTMDYLAGFGANQRFIQASNASANTAETHAEITTETHQNDEKDSLAASDSEKSEHLPSSTDQETKAHSAQKSANIKASGRADGDDVLNVSLALKELEASKYAENSSMATWINCLRRFKNTQNVQHASQAISESIETLAAQLESGNSLIRYFIWAIPSIGFIGTVRGIGSALAKAEEAVAGDISGMVDKLGVAFNSTLVSLLISIVLMYLLHMLNNRQDEMVINTRKNCEKHLLTRLHN
ncbi:MotA/TolQ/ExbB proton channel family protein [Glaciecola siphonariae]|uniref:MotA/TolQ/ExbB proton channel family protein n=1 Tax=Glaciecola siphonariae TaxID=521012 RepID=A0ABV9LYA7_9ALTE